MEQLQPTQQKMNLLIYRDFSKNFKASFAFIKENYGNILKGACFFIPFAILGAYFMPSQSDLQDQLLDAIGNPIEMLSVYGELLFPYIFITIGSYCIMLYVACYMAEYQKSNTSEINQGAVWARFGKAVLPVFISWILYLMMTVVGTFLCIIPGVIVAVLLYFFAYSIVEEGSSITGGLTRSYELIKTDLVNAILFGIVCMIIVGLISSIFSSGLYVIQIIASVTKEEASPTALLIAQIVANVGQMLVYPMLYIAAGIQYYSLRRKEELMKAGAPPQAYMYDGLNQDMNQNQGQNFNSNQQYTNPHDNPRYNQY